MTEKRDREGQMSCHLLILYELWLKGFSKELESVFNITVTAYTFWLLLSLSSASLEDSSMLRTIPFAANKKEAKSSIKIQSHECITNLAIYTVDLLTLF